jgi:predicted acylesterase/phospholipase RssA
MEGVRRKALVAFQGGGAKGISHVGALAALERLELDVVGYAGTSAGALVAALGAAGFSAEQIFSTNGDGNHALKTLNPSIDKATKLFGTFGWIFILTLRWVAAPKPLTTSDASGDTLSGVVHRWLAWLAFIIVAGAVAFLALGTNHWVSWAPTLSGGFWSLLPESLVAVSLVSLGLPARRVSIWGLRARMIVIVGAAGWLLGSAAVGWTRESHAAVTLFICFWMALPISLALILVFFARGLATTKKVQIAIDQLLKDKLKTTESNRPSTQHLDWNAVKKDGLSFRFFEQATGKSLRVVATDVTNKTVRVFSAHDTPDVAVADAVCASVGLPLIFHVQHLDVSALDAPSKEWVSLMDGGLLSNLPLWVFDEDRAFDRSILTIGMSLERATRADASPVVAVPSKIAPEARSTLRRKPFNPFFWVARVLDAIVSGPGLIHRRAIDGLVLVKVPSGLTMLSFDETHEAFCAEIKRAHTEVLNELGLQIDLPDRLRENLRAFRDRLIVNLEKAITTKKPNSRTLASLKVSGQWDIGVALAVERPGFRRSLWIDVRVGRSELEGSRETVILHRDSIEGAQAQPAKWVISVASGEPFSSSTWMIALHVDRAVPLTKPAPRPDRTVLLYIDSASLDAPDDLALETCGQVAQQTLDSYLLDFIKITGKNGTRESDNVDFLEQVLRAQIWE